MISGRLDILVEGFGLLVVIVLVPVVSVVLGWFGLVAASAAVVVAAVGADCWGPSLAASRMFVSSHLPLPSG